MKFKLGIDYRKLSKAERNGYKYELLKDYHYKHPIDLPYAYLSDYISLWPTSLVIYKPYRWNGSNVVFDTKYCMGPSAVHDALQQLINEGKLSREYQKYIDRLYRNMIIEDAKEDIKKEYKDKSGLERWLRLQPWKWRAGFRYTGLRLWDVSGLKRLFAVGVAAKGKKK